MRYILTIFGLMGCAVFFGFMMVQDVQACSGGATDTIANLLSRTEYVVQGEAVAVDDVHQNGVLRVSSYLVGGAGPEYLLFSQNDPAVIERMLEGAGFGTCDFFQQNLVLGKTAYFFLSRRVDGAYVSTTVWFEPDFYTFSDDATAVFYSREDDEFTEHRLTESQFIEFIAEQSQQTASEPIKSPSYPRLAPLKLTTANGTDYFLPVDSVAPVAVTDEVLTEMTQATLGYESPTWNESYFIPSTCPGEACTQVSPNGLQRAWRRGDDVIWFTGSAPGQAFHFASTSDAIAVWNHHQLDIYTLGYERPDQDFSDVMSLNSVTLSQGDDAAFYRSAWSPDGRLLAFSDDDGLWLLDVYNSSAEPSLLLASENAVVPEALQFSPMGRYVQIARGDERATLDIVTGELFTDGVVSADDRLLLAYDTQAGTFDVQICYLAPVNGCEALRETFIRLSEEEIHFYDQFTRVEWRDNYSFWAMACQRDELNACVVDQRYNESGRLWRDSVYVIEGNAFDYLADGDYLAVVQDDYSVLVNDQLLDMTGEVDSPIVSVEWLSSLFYDR
jgi:hypothetical protein